MMMVEMRVVYTIDVSGNIKTCELVVDGTVGSKEHKDIDQGAHGHKDISLRMEFFSTRM